MKNFLKIVGAWLIIEAFIFAWLFSLSSCSSVKKTVHKEQVKIDSVHILKRDSTTLKKVDSTGSKTETATYKRWTEYLYDTLYLPGDTIVEYIPRLIRAYEEGDYSKNETASKSTYDSTSKKVTDSTRLKKETKEFEKRVEKYKPSLWIYGLCIFGVIVLVVKLYYYLRKRKIIQQ